MESAKSEVAVLPLDIESMSSSVSEGHLSTVIAHRRRDGQVTLLQRESEVRDPREGVFQLRTILPKGGPVSVATAIDVVPAGSGRWFAWLRDGKLAASNGWEARSLQTRNRPPLTDSSSALDFKSPPERVFSERCRLAVAFKPISLLPREFENIGVGIWGVAPRPKVLFWDMRAGPVGHCGMGGAWWSRDEPVVRPGRESWRRCAEGNYTRTSACMGFGRIGHANDLGCHQRPLGICGCPDRSGRRSRHDAASGSQWRCWMGSLRVHHRRDDSRENLQRTAGPAGVECQLRNRAPGPGDAHRIVERPYDLG